MLMKTNSAVLAAALLLSGTINAAATAIVYTDPRFVEHGGTEQHRSCDS